MFPYISSTFFYSTSLLFLSSYTNASVFFYSYISSLCSLSYSFFIQLFSFFPTPPPSPLPYIIYPRFFSFYYLLSCSHSTFSSSSSAFCLALLIFMHPLHLPPPSSFPPTFPASCLPVPPHVRPPVPRPTHPFTRRTSRQSSVLVSPNLCLTFSVSRSSLFAHFRDARLRTPLNSLRCGLLWKELRKMSLASAKS